MSRHYSRREEVNRNLILDIYKHVLGPLDSSRVDDYMATDYIQHSPMAKTGAAGLKTFLDWARANTPHAEHHVKRVFVDGDFIIAQVHVIIHPGDQGNVVIDIFRIENGRVAEHWDAVQPITAESANSNGVF